MDVRGHVSACLLWCLVADALCLSHWCWRCCAMGMRYIMALPLSKVSSILAWSSGRLLLLGFLLVSGLARADTVCTQTGPDTIQITEPVLVSGTSEPLTEINACVLPAGFTAPA